ncbi:hypothetical protein ASE98_17635 [Pseudomonas sp. Leaf48]|uniref:hypothetical protein n=1 Tax=Pseudomonas sp. Leaf48 TaxID=1736221 RepID=UPI0007274D2B|nr:hypothetical protein [Pseudomonas sp. Leaf48]KQN53989.1 hypothetical protein ASE98_17635 [Pseudomonas sp. Leaf48]
MTQTTRAPGTIDPGFGQRGFAFFPLPGSEGLNRTVTILPDKRVLVTLVYPPFDDVALGLAVFKEDGSLDPVFGSGGIKDISFSQSLTFYPNTVLLLTSGGWLIAGTASTEKGLSLAVAKFQADGSLDPTYGAASTPGLTLIDVDDLVKGATLLSSDQAPTDIMDNDGGNGAISATQQDGKIVIGSVVSVEGTPFPRGIVIQLDSTGNLDITFNCKGYLLVNLPDGLDWTNVMAVRFQDDYLVVCGNYRKDLKLGGYFNRYDRLGNLDRSFGERNNGTVLISLDDRLVRLSSFTVKSDNSLIGAGYVMDNQIGGLVVHLTPKGSYNLLFNGGTPLVSKFLDSGVLWRTSMVQSDSNLIIAGQGGEDLGELRSSITARLLPNGDVDLKYADKGWVEYPSPDVGGNHTFRDAALKSDDYMYVSETQMEGGGTTRGSVFRYLV